MDSTDIYITQVNVTYRLTCIALYLVYCIRSLDVTIFHEDVMDICYACLVSWHEVFPLIEYIGINLEEASCACSMTVAHIDMVDEATAPMIGFKIHHSEDAVGSLAVFHQYIPYASTHLASDAKQAMSFYYLAIAHHNVFCRLSHTPCVPVASRLNDHSIVALVELTILNEHVLCHFKVYAVVVMVVRIDIEVARYPPIAQKEMYCPEWCAIDAKAVEQDIRASVKVYEMRSHVILAYRHLALLHRHISRAPCV